MPSIALIVKDLGPAGTKSTWHLMKAFGLNVAAINQAVLEKSPVVTRNLFDRQERSFPIRLVALLEILSALGCQWEMFELPDRQEYKKGNAYFEITVERLRKMIETRQISLAHQRRQGEFEVSEEAGEGALDTFSNESKEEP